MITHSPSLKGLLVLPEAPPITIRCEADYYGASQLVARALGLSEPPVSASSWVHGCDMFPVPREVFSPHFQTPDQTHLVANLRTARWWHQNGYHKAVAVGCPILYTQPSGMERRAGSALIMPNHSLPGCQRDKEHSANWLLMVSGLKSRFSSMVVCLHADDVAELAPQVEAAGLGWITGARLETLSLPRMRAIFESFEFMFTDVQGSHLPYAAWCGCKVALLEPLYVRLWDQFKDHPHFKRYPELRKNLAFHQPEDIKTRHPYLFVDKLEDAICPRDWAEELLGVSHVREPAELARLLGWRWDASDPAFKEVGYDKAASWLGAVNPDPALGSLQHEIARLKSKQSELKAVARQEAKAMKAAQKQLLADDVFKRSASGRLARLLYSIEKRIRRLFGKTP